MMKPISFFWYLYGAVALALILTITTLFFTINYVEGQNDWQDFARDVHQTLLMANVECQVEDLNHECVQSLFKDHGFEITSEFYSEGSERVGDWQSLDRLIEIYGYQAGFQAQVGDQQGIWIRDDWEHLEDAAGEDDVFGMFVTATAITLVLLASIAVFLYWPVKRLILWLKALENASDAVGKEDYSVNLASLNVRPFDQLSQRFNNMTLLIRNNLEEKRLLANAMAHELRTPLSRARLALGLLQRKPDTDMQTELISDLDRYLDDLEKVTDNSLQLVQLQNSEAHLSELSLDSWLEAKLQRIQGLSSKVRAQQGHSLAHSTLAHSEQIQWHSDLAKCSIKTDERFLTLIIDNLFSNAERHALTKVKVELTLQGENKVLIIQDDGPGIPKELRSKALKPFSRLDESRDRRSGGIGLGLALVSTACQRLNIALEFEDEGQGLRVKLTMR